MKEKTQNTKKAKIYIIRNTQNNIAYIGVTTRPLMRRFKAHMATNNRTHKFAQNIELIEKKNFYISLLETCDIVDAFDRETQIIEKFINNGYTLYNEYKNVAIDIEEFEFKNYKIIKSISDMYKVKYEKALLDLYNDIYKKNPIDLETFITENFKEYNVGAFKITPEVKKLIKKIVNEEFLTTEKVIEYCKLFNGLEINDFENEWTVNNFKQYIERYNIYLIAKKLNKEQHEKIGLEYSRENRKKALFIID